MLDADSLDLGEEQGAPELPLNNGGSFAADTFEELQLRYLLGESEHHRDYAVVQQVGLEVEVRWSEQDSGPYPRRTPKTGHLWTPEKRPTG